MSREYVDCGDNSCLCCPPEQKKGMRTNGGCSCFKMLKTADRMRAHRAVTYWKNRAMAAESVISVKMSGQGNENLLDPGAEERHEDRLQKLLDQGLIQSYRMLGEDEAEVTLFHPLKYVKIDLVRLSDEG